MIELGYTVRDVVTGFTGIATARVEYLNGCVQFCVTPKAVDNKVVDSVYIDHQRLEALDQGLTATRSATGGEMRDAPPSCYRG